MGYWKNKQIEMYQKALDRRRAYRSKRCYARRQAIFEGQCQGCGKELQIEIPHRSSEYLIGSCECGYLSVFGLRDSGFGAGQRIEKIGAI